MIPLRPHLIGGLVLALTATGAVAQQSGQYFGVYGFGPVASEYDYEPEAGGQTSGDELWRLKLGYQLGRFLAAEVHYGFNEVDAGSNAPPRLREGAVFGRFQLPYEQVNVYLLAGTGRVSGDFGGDNRDLDTGPAAGLGIELFGTDRTAFGVEYVQYRLGEAERDYKALTVGFKHHFEWPSFRSE